MRKSAVLFLCKCEEGVFRHGCTLQITDELVRALSGRYPNAVLQFEDFNMAHALPLLDRYREHHLCFNDDVQVSLWLEL